jgi:hypothetical protein
MGISDMLSGGYQLDSDVRDIANIATFIGGLTPLGPIGAGIIGAAINQMFGHGAPHLTNIGIEGSVGASQAVGGSGTSLQGFKNIRENGGTYTSDRNTRSNFAIDPKVAESLMKDVDANLANMKKATTLLGLTSTQKFESFTQSISLEFMDKSVAEQQQMLIDTLKTFNNGMLNSVFPIFERFKLEGEDAIGAMNRLATSYTIAGDASKMLSYGDTFGLGTGAIAGDYANSILMGGFNVDALRAAGIASGRVTNADFYGTHQELVSAAVAASAPIYESLPNFGKNGSGSSGYINVGGKNGTIEVEPGYALVGNGKNGQTIVRVASAGNEARAAVYKTVVNSTLDPVAAANADAVLRAEQADKMITDFGGKEAYQKTMTGYFNTFYSDKEKVALNLKLAKEQLDKISKDTGLNGTMTDITKDTKLQDKKDAYRKITDEAYAAYQANPTDANRIRYFKLVDESASYISNVSTAINAQKYQANPVDAATKNANLQASLNAMANVGVGSSGIVSAADIAGASITGASHLGKGYNVSENVAAVTGGTGTDGITVVPVYGSVIPGTNGGMNVATNGGSTGTLFAPTTYVDNTSTSSTNVNAGGNDGVRDTYSHPILGSTERSISSTYNYNYLYR